MKKSKKLPKEFRDILEKVPEDRKAIAKNIMDELIFMQDVLQNLKENIREHGVVDDFQNGKQHFLKESPAVKSYNTTVQRYGGLYKQLENMLPKEERKDASAALLDFIRED